MLDRTAMRPLRPCSQPTWPPVAAMMRPIPRGIGETTYVIAPNTMIESTLMTQSRMAIAVASASGMP